jgi:hypothetical protein
MPLATLAQEKNELEPGWLSLDKIIGPFDSKVDDTKLALRRALGINIDAFLDVSYTYSFNHPGSGNHREISLREFDRDHNRVVFNDFHISLEKPEHDWGVGLKLAADFGRTAEILRQSTFWGTQRSRGGAAELREAFLTSTIPVGQGLKVKGGWFESPLGLESLPHPGSYNDNISRSFLFNFAVPHRHLGLLFTYPIHKVLSVSAGPVTGWDMVGDINHQPSFLGSMTLSPNKAFSWESGLVVGPEQRHRSGPKRLAWSNVVTIEPNEALTLSFEYTYGHEEKVTASLRAGTWQGVAAIASHDWTDRFTTALRGEFFNDRDGVVNEVLARNVRLGELTLTGAYKFTAKLLGRVEARQDWANRSIFQQGDTGAKKNQTTLALQVIYAF